MTISGNELTTTLNRLEYNYIEAIPSKFNQYIYKEYVDELRKNKNNSQYTSKILGWLKYLLYNFPENNIDKINTIVGDLEDIFCVNGILAIFHRLESDE